MGRPRKPRAPLWKKVLETEWKQDRNKITDKIKTEKVQFGVSPHDRCSQRRVLQGAGCPPAQGDTKLRATISFGKASSMFTVAASPLDTLLSSYRFSLPETQIAQEPGERGGSRLLVTDRVPEGTAGPVHARFADLPDYLPRGALLVANNSRVVPARLMGRRPGGGRAEFLLLTPLPLAGSVAAPQGATTFVADVEGLIRPAARIRPGDELVFAPARETERDPSRADAGMPERGGLRVTVLEKGAFGRCRARLCWSSACDRGGEETAAAALRRRFETLGHLPLPPYIRRPDTPEDARRYQTVYAREDKAGSVAAPTAGLHFTEDMRRQLREKGFEWAEVTLHVGYGTFSPVRCADLRDHVMHAEYAEVPAETALAVNRARAAGRPVLAVGTTAARTLEGAAAATGGETAGIGPYAGWVNIFIRPGYVFRIIDGLITNFHLPESTLLMLVSALTGRERMLALYADAVERGYRFFSYGDAMLIR